MLVVSSPSGAGKTSLCRRLADDCPAITLSVSATTRPPRDGERDGVEYLFVDEAKFDAMAARGDFLEWARVHGHRYGTPRGGVMAALESGADALFDIDWQGARSIRAAAPEDTVSVFILPPSMAELARRLHRRAQDDETVIARRLGGAKAEIGKWDEYDYVIVNADFEVAYGELSVIYRAERARRVRNLWISPFVQSLLGEKV
jgi:guanylate kinase